MANFLRTLLFAKIKLQDVSVNICRNYQPLWCPVCHDMYQINFSACCPLGSTLIGYWKARSSWKGDGMEGLGNFILIGEEGRHSPSYGSLSCLAALLAFSSHLVYKAEIRGNRNMSPVSFKLIFPNEHLSVTRPYLSFYQPCSIMRLDYLLTTIPCL